MQATMVLMVTGRQLSRQMKPLPALTHAGQRIPTTTGGQAPGQPKTSLLFATRAFWFFYVMDQTIAPSIGLKKKNGDRRKINLLWWPAGELSPTSSRHKRHMPWQSALTAVFSPSPPTTTPIAFIFTICVPTTSATGLSYLDWLPITESAIIMQTAILSARLPIIAVLKFLHQLWITESIWRAAPLLSIPGEATGISRETTSTSPTVKQTMESQAMTIETRRQKPSSAILFRR